MTSLVKSEGREIGGREVIVPIRKSGDVRVRRPIVRYDSTQDVRNVESYMLDPNCYTAPGIDLSLILFDPTQLAFKSLPASVLFLRQ